MPPVNLCPPPPRLPQVPPCLCSLHVPCSCLRTSAIEAHEHVPGQCCRVSLSFASHRSFPPPFLFDPLLSGAFVSVLFSPPRSFAFSICLFSCWLSSSLIEFEISEKFLTLGSSAGTPSILPPQIYCDDHTGDGASACFRLYRRFLIHPNLVQHPTLKAAAGTRKKSIQKLSTGLGIQTGETLYKQTLTKSKLQRVYCMSYQYDDEQSWLGIQDPFHQPTIQFLGRDCHYLI